LFDSKNILPMVNLKGTLFPSHTLYTDDVFVFCRANKRRLGSIIQLFQMYGSANKRRLGSIIQLLITDISSLNVTPFWSVVLSRILVLFCGGR